MTLRPLLLTALVGRLRTSLAASLLLLASLGLVPAALAAPKVIVISLDGAAPWILDDYLAQGAFGTEGLALIKDRGISAKQNVTVNPSLTAPAHIAIATGSIAAHNDVPANLFHLVASPFTSNISGFSAPIGGYDIHGSAGSHAVTAEPLWLALRAAGKVVATATFPGGDGLDIRVPGLQDSPIVQPAAQRTVDYTVPFGAFGGVGARGFSLAAADFSPAGAILVAELAAAGRSSFSPIQQKITPLESFAVGGVSYQILVAALDTSNDGLVNYDTLVFFDAALGILPGPFSLPSTGPAYVRSADKKSALFYLENSSNKAGTGFYVSHLAPDLSLVRITRYSANAIPRNAPVLADVDDINTRVGFWAPQPDFRIPERLSPGFDTFPDIELEDVYADLVRLFVDYQTRIALRAIERVPDADLVMVYIEQPDGSGHQFLLTDPRQPTDPRNPASIGAGQDPAKVARYAGYLKAAYQAASAAVQRIVDAVGTDQRGVPKSNIFVVSDHGFEAFHTVVSMPNLLAGLGFDPAKVRAVTSGPSVNVYINLAGREPNGSVLPAEYVALQQQISEALKGVADTNPVYTKGKHHVPLFDKVYRRPLPRELDDPGFGLGTNRDIGQDSGDVFALLQPGYNFDGIQTPVVIRLGDPAAPAPVLQVPNFYGAHGYHPDLARMSAIFMAAGPDIRGGKLQRVHNIDVAPTVARLLGVEPARTVDGHVIPVRIPRAVKADLRQRLVALLPTGDPSTDGKLARAIAHLDTGLGGHLWDDDERLGRRGAEAYAADRKAVQELLDIDQGPPAIAEVIRGLVAVAEEVAAIVLDEASATHRQDGALLRAQWAREQACAEAKEGRFGRALAGYAVAWQHARRALP